MTVKELIAVLEALPPDLPVEVEYNISGGGYARVTGARLDPYEPESVVIESEG